jgi:hypothetical protein
MADTTPNLHDFAVGERVELHPATDAWMQGDRYGQVVLLGRRYVHIKMERSGRVLRKAPRHVMKVAS